jgi:hypothetical protein
VLIERFNYAPLKAEQMVKSSAEDDSSFTERIVACSDPDDDMVLGVWPPRRK